MTDLSFPDNNRREPGSWVMPTVQAMRTAKGDRAAAAKALGISEQTLAGRIHKIKRIARRG